MEPQLTPPPMSNRILSTNAISSHVVTEVPAQTHYIAATNFSNLCDMHYIYTTCYALNCIVTRLEGWIK